jgi:hypothetical protein
MRTFSRLISPDDRAPPSDDADFAGVEIVDEVMLNGIKNE